MPPEFRPDPGPTTRRFRVRIRYLMIAVAVVALVAGGVAHYRRAGRLRAERELLEALRLQDAESEKAEAMLKELEDSTPENLDRRARERLAEKRREAERLLKELEPHEPQRKGWDGVLPDPRPEPVDGRTVL